MSLSITWDSGSRPLATNSGWSAFGRWVDSLDAGIYKRVVQFWEHGHVGDVAEFVQQLEGAILAVPPEDQSVLATTRGLLESARTAGDTDHLFVDSGLGTDEGEDEFDEEAAEFDPSGKGTS